MTTQMIKAGAVKFNGVTLEMGKPVLVDGRKGTPFLAWVRPADTQVRFKWENTYMPSDFSSVYGKRVKIQEVGA